MITQLERIIILLHSSLVCIVSIWRLHLPIHLLVLFYSKLLTAYPSCCFFNNNSRSSYTVRPFMPVLYLRHRSLLPPLLCRSSPVTRPLPQVSLHSNLLTIYRLLSASPHTTFLTSPAISQHLLPHLCHTTSLFLPTRPYTLLPFPSIPRILPPTCTTACPLLLLLVSTRPTSGCRPCPLCPLLFLPLSRPLSSSLLPSHSHRSPECR